MNDPDFIGVLRVACNLRSSKNKYEESKGCSAFILLTIYKVWVVLSHEESDIKSGLKDMTSCRQCQPKRGQY